jgi:GTP cyclohydrolase I
MLNNNEMEGLYRSIIEGIGEDPLREGLLKTPERVSKAMKYLTHGYEINPDDIVNQAIFHEEYSEMVLVKDIEIYSLCEHHMLPFFGKAHIAYIPDGKIVGLSKLPRVVDAYARRLQVQERLTIEIRDCIQRTLNPKGVAVVIECSHMCMQMRGVQKQNSATTTSAFTGIFLNNDATRREFINLVQAAERFERRGSRFYQECLYLYVCSIRYFRDFSLFGRFESDLF